MVRKVMLSPWSVKYTKLESCGQLVVAGNSAAHLGIVADNQGSGSLGACLLSQACSYHTQPSTPPYSGSEQGASNSEHATLSCHVLWPAYSVKHSQHNDYLMMVVSRNILLCHAIAGVVWLIMR